MLTGYLMAGVSIVLLYVAGLALGVRLPAGRWIEMTALILVALIPFAGMGIAIGHLVTRIRSARRWAASRRSSPSSAASGSRSRAAVSS